MSEETRDPAGALRGLVSPPPLAECRVEIAGDDGAFTTLIPYFRLHDPAGAIALTGPIDPAGRPVRLMIHDEVAGEYVADYALFGATFHVDPSGLPMGHLLRYRFYFWFPELNAWTEQGLSRIVPGSGVLADATAADSRADAVWPRLDSRLPAGWAQSEGVVEFFDHSVVLADATASDYAAVKATLGRVLSVCPISELRVRLVTVKADGSPRSGGLEPVAGAEPFTAALLDRLRGDGKVTDEIEGALLYRQADDNERTRSYIASLLFRAIPEGVCHRPNAFDLGSAENLYQAWRREADGSVLIGELFNYLRLYEILRQETVERGFTWTTFFDPDHLRGIVEPALSRIAALPAYDPAMFSSRAVNAKLEGLRSRERAAELFAELMAEPHPMRAVTDFEDGANTYFQASRIEAAAPALAARRATLIAELRTLSRPREQGDAPVVVFSCDPRFLAIYLPYWLTVVDYAKARGMEFHLVLNAGTEAAAEVLERVDALRRSLAALRGANAAAFADNLSYSTWAAPDWCPNRTAFYACSRYLAAGELTRRFGREVLIQDIDFILTRDPAGYLKRFPGPGIGLQSSEGLYGLDPWRRFMGGTFSIPDSDAARRTLGLLELYLLEGLGQADSWYLDQNALAYLVETVRLSPNDHPPFWDVKEGRPTEQFHGNKLFEAEQGPLPYL